MVLYYFKHKYGVYTRIQIDFSEVLSITEIAMRNFKHLF